MRSINNEDDFHEDKNSSKKKVSTDIYKDQFIDFIFKDPINKFLVWGCLIIVIIQLIFFKYWYPYASFINGDSYSYLISAFNNFDIDTYPIGYSKFLRLFSVFSHSDTVLVIFQYLSIQFSGIALIFSLFYFFSPTIITKFSLLILFILNPVFLYLGNYISSDALFLSLSVIWFTLLLWSIFRPSFIIITTLSVILFISFTVRYNALYYPIITLIGILLINKRKIILGTTGLTICIFFIAEFISFNKDKYHDLTGTRQFSAFSGWQIANNALYAYKFVDGNKLKKLPNRFHELDHMVRAYFDSTTNNPNHPEGKWMVSTVYMWTNSTPLRMYMSMKYGKVEEKEFENWAKVAPFYREYGIELIKTYPFEFSKFFLFPNALKFYTPPVEYLKSYSTGVDSVKPIAQLWFNYKSNKLDTIFKDYNVNVLNFYPIWIGMLNILFILTLLTSFVIKINHPFKHFKKLTILVFSLWIFNFSFSIIVSPIALRFQLFPTIIISSYLIIYVEKFLLTKESGFDLKKGTYD